MRTKKDQDRVMLRRIFCSLIIVIVVVIIIYSHRLKHARVETIFLEELIGKDAEEGEEEFISWHF